MLANRWLKEAWLKPAVSSVYTRPSRSACARVPLFSSGTRSAGKQSCQACGKSLVRMQPLVAKARGLQAGCSSRERRQSWRSVHPNTSEAPADKVAARRTWMEVVKWRRVSSGSVCQARNTTPLTAITAYSTCMSSRPGDLRPHSRFSVGDCSA